MLLGRERDWAEWEILRKMSVDRDLLQGRAQTGRELCGRAWTDDASRDDHGRGVAVQTSSDASRELGRGVAARMSSDGSPDGCVAAQTSRDDYFR
ncbi:hypothetical protein TorRG33x02_340770, partial [Trema orientale]